MIVKAYDRCRLDDIPTIQAVKRTWESLCKCSCMERHKGLHQTNYRDFDEVHAQILGWGKM